MSDKRNATKFLVYECIFRFSHWTDVEGIIAKFRIGHFTDFQGKVMTSQLDKNCRVNSHLAFGILRAARGTS